MGEAWYTAAFFRPFALTSHPQTSPLPSAPQLSRALTLGLTGWRRAGDATRGVSARDCRDSPRWWVLGSGTEASPTASPAGGTPHGDTPWGDLPCLPGRGA